MKVLLFHPTLLPPKDYGGVERVVLWLARGLCARGHSVAVAALPGSELPPGIELLKMDRGSVSALDLISRIPAGTDIVHFMAPPEKGTWERLPCGGILTVHGNGREGETFPENTVFLSADHARRHGRSVFVHNGLDPDEYEFNPGRRERWALFLSKTSWRVKNVRGAVDICRLAKQPLRVAGGSRPWVVRARVALSRGMKWEGAVSGARKAALLAQARALIFPVLWNEPFGLVVAEALVSGTPVLASRIGSLPELLDPSVGALLPVPQAANPEEAWAAPWEAPWVEALTSRRWDPEVCRGWALSRFHFLQMAAGYEELYKKVMSSQPLQSPT